MATKDFKIRNGLIVGGTLTLGGNTVSKVLDSDAVAGIALANSGSIDSDVAAVAQLRRDADSDSIRIQEIATSLEQINELVDSDLKAIADLRNDVDSDSIKIQSLSTTVSGLSGGGTSNIISPVAFAFVNTTANSSGTNISWSNWNAGSATLDFTFTTAQSDTNYAIITDCDVFDDYNVSISSKTTSGFTASFYDDSGSNRTPSSSAPFTFLIYGSNPNVLISGVADAGFDSDQVVAIINENSSGSGMTDSDLKVVADLRNDVTALQTGGVVPQESTFTTFKYKATQGQTTFSGLDRDNQTLSYTVGNINVFINGILINDSDDYTATNGTSVVLLLAADSDDVVVVQKARSAFDSDTILSIWNNNQANLTITRFDYTATQSQTVFSGADDNGNTLSYIATKIQVYLNGILLLDGSDYTATNGTSLTLTVAADSDDKLSIIKYLGADAAASDNINVTAYTFTSPANDSDFSGLDNNGRTLAYVANKIHVYLNGILLSNSTDYTAVDGSSVTLTNAPDSDDVLTVIKYLGTTQSGFDSDQVVAIINENLPVDQTGFDSDQVVAIINENLPVDQTGFDSDQVVAIINENSSGGGGLGDYGAVNSTGTAASATGTDAIAIGENAVANGTDTVAIGKLSGGSNSQTITAVGAQALRNNSGGAGNTAVGYSAGYSSGRESVFVGMSAGQGNQSTVYGNTYLGYQAGLADQGGYNIAIGHKANGYSSGSSASYQIYIGGGAGGGRTVPAGGMNRNGTIGIGLEAGAQSGAFNQSPSLYDGPVFIGNFVGSRVQGQNNYNVGIGTCSFHPQGGSNQVNYSYCVGIGGLNYTSTSATSGTLYCVAVGHKANESLGSGANYNTSIGALAGKNTTTGTNNTFIGYNAGYNVSTNSNNIAIGTSNLGGNYSGSIVIGNSLTSKGNNTAYIGGSSSIYNQVNTSSWQTVSDERIKKNITEYSNGLNKLDLVNVKTYNYKPDSEIATDSPELTDSDGNVNLSLNTEKTVVGLIAQELETVLPNSVLTAENGIKSIDTDELFWVMLNSIKELKARVEALENA